LCSANIERLASEKGFSGRTSFAPAIDGGARAPLKKPKARCTFESRAPLQGQSMNKHDDTLDRPILSLSEGDHLHLRDLVESTVVAAGPDSSSRADDKQQRGRVTPSVHFSSATDEWETPRSLFDELSTIFGGFTLDPCATPQNAKCQTFFTREQDGLARRWGGKVFMNPPYGRDIGRWVKKAYDESLRGALVVCLLPARTDPRWWQDYVKHGYVYFLRGRLRFGTALNSAPFPSAIVTFGKFFSC
jgi:phage N-6-adenine-methyltransferase